MNNIQKKIQNNSFINIEQIKTGLEVAEKSVSSKFFVSSSTQQKKDNIKIILKALESSVVDENEKIGSVDKHIKIILENINLLKDSSIVSDEEYLDKLNKLNQSIKDYLGRYRTKIPLTYFYRLTKTSTNSLRAYNNSYQSFLFEEIKKYNEENWLISDFYIKNFILLCKTYKTLFGDNKFKDLLISLIDDSFNQDRLDIVIKLVNLYKSVLLKKSKKFYTKKISEVFEKIHDYQILKKFIKYHPYCINYRQKKIVIKKYKETTNIDIIRLICDCVINQAQYIVLPPRRIIYEDKVFEVGKSHIYSIDKAFDINFHNKIIKRDLEKMLSEIKNTDH